MFDAGGCRPPTQGEYDVLLWCSQWLCLLLGLIGFGFCLFAPPENSDQADLLGDISSIVFVIGLVLWAARRFLKRFG